MSSEQKQPEAGQREQIVTPDLLREWPLPAGGDSKLDRGQVVIVGGSARAPGAAMLAGRAALRVGAGRLTLALPRSVAVAVAVAVPEAGVIALDESDAGEIRGTADALAALRDDLNDADAVLIGPGLADPDETAGLLEAIAPLLGASAVVVLDAFALGVLGTHPHLRDAFPTALLLTPNATEAGFLLGRDAEPDDAVGDAAEIAARFGAVVSFDGHLAAPDGSAWRLGTGTSGLGTSGSGDVLAGAILGLCARGLEPARAAVWGSHAHALAGDRLAVAVGPVGYLASELLAELPRVLVEVAQ
jgi:ADP-dependent NAD(P)H-hydrate dehydratase